jgi:hypothetical protein
MVTSSVTMLVTNSRSLAQLSVRTAYSFWDGHLGLGFHQRRKPQVAMQLRAVRTVPRWVMDAVLRLSVRTA